jgi:23S rRNA (guanine745-N1)-methyltransferase
MLGIEEGKEARLAEAMGEHFDGGTASAVDIPLALTRQEAADLAFMGPAGHHLDRGAVSARLQGLPEPITAEAKFQVMVFHPTKGATA